MIAKGFVPYSVANPSRSWKSTAGKRSQSVNREWDGNGAAGPRETGGLVIGNAQSLCDGSPACTAHGVGLGGPGVK
jgi:hypothetical protein